MVPRWQIFDDYFCVLYLQRAACSTFTPAYEIRTKATPCVEVWQASNLRRLRLGEEKKKDRYIEEEEGTTG